MSYFVVSLLSKQKESCRNPVSDFWALLLRKIRSELRLFVLQKFFAKVFFLPFFAIVLPIAEQVEQVEQVEQEKLVFCCSF